MLFAAVHGSVIGPKATWRFRQGALDGRSFLARLPVRRLVGVVWISTLVPVALRATRVEGGCHLRLCSILRRRALGAGGVRPMVDHTLGVPAGFFRL